ncbi:hypothetical protein CCACVL1_01017 [Corchorus capsularis]|uniref:Uncharacterized protein n=1 Tax=Corchorus capsularis TaxID=210143 RepID=A0A1R3KSP9_COCAP|nr:hypothetical protein CCACVL1_01017 [Corchorus capsularis]
MALSFFAAEKGDLKAFHDTKIKGLDFENEELITPGGASMGWWPLF